MWNPLKFARVPQTPNSAQVGSTPYHSPKLHPGPCSSVGIQRRTVTNINRQTDRQTHRCAWPLYISRRLRLTPNVMIKYPERSGWLQKFNQLFSGLNIQTHRQTNTGQNITPCQAGAEVIKAPEGGWWPSPRDLDLGLCQDHICMHNTYTTTSIPNHVAVVSSNREIWPFKNSEKFEVTRCDSLKKLSSDKL